MTERKFGHIMWFKNEKGFGFLRPEGASQEEEMFFHWTQLEMEGYKTIEPETRISFEIDHNHRGPMAVKIRAEDAA